MYLSIPNRTLFGAMFPCSPSYSGRKREHFFSARTSSFYFSTLPIVIFFTSFVPLQTFIPGFVSFPPFTSWTEVFAFKSFALFFKHVGMFRSCVLAWTREKFQVLNSVISRVVVDVVNYFHSGQIPSQVFLHNQSVFSNISLLATIRMILPLNVPILTSFDSARIFRDTHNNGSITPVDYPVKYPAMFEVWTVKIKGT